MPGRQPRYDVRVGDSLGITLSLDEGTSRGQGTIVYGPTLTLLCEASRPRASSALYRLNGIRDVVLGRGKERGANRHGADGGELTIAIPDRWMSSRHARIEHRFGRWAILDCGSKNGTLVNGEVVERVSLSDGDLIELGHTLLVFRERCGFADTAALHRDFGAEADARVVGPDDAVSDQIGRLPGMSTTLPSYDLELERLRQIARSEIPIIVEGESGTGKELLARAVHTLSGRRGRFIAVNCGAIPANLVESELFGHKKGAFSGALEDHQGLVRAADGGTLFLDEIGDLPAGSQAALLRVLQEREVVPVGSTRPVSVDLRVVAATHRHLDALIERGSFRHDLFARLAGHRISPPRLADRIDDLGLLIAALHARHFKAEDHPGFEVETVRALYQYAWPLNIRELEQCLATAAVVAADRPVALADLPEAIRSGDDPESPARSPHLSAADLEQRAELDRVLRDVKGNISAAARELQKDRKQIQRWIKRFGLEPSSYR